MAVGLFAIALLALVAGYGWQEAREVQAARASVAHTVDVQRRVAELDRAVLLMESEHRGHLVNGDPGFLEAREQARAVARAALADLRALTADNAAQQRHLDLIDTRLGEREARMAAISALVAYPGLDAAQSSFNPAARGSVLPLRSAIADLGRTEAALFEKRSAAAALRSSQLRWILFLGPGLGIVLLAAAMFALVRQFDRSQRMGEAMARDLAARRRAEDERDRFFELSLDMLCISGDDGYFKRLSPAFTRTLGWSVEELLARPYTDFVHPDDLAATLAVVERQIRDGEDILSFENRYRHQDGSWRVLSWKSSPQPGGRMFATARDVTANRQAEHRITRLNQELTARQGELEAANRELESFSYSVSHDLRAPLRHIDGYARMLLEDVGDGLPAEARRFLDTIVASARRMGLLIDDLLAFSRLGRKPMTRVPIDMDGLVRAAISESSEATGARPAISIGPLPRASGDPALMRQVWANLVSNAFKYSATRGGQARVEVGADLRADGQARYWIRDNGVGFDMRYADKLFGVFHRLHPQDQFEGTGVGLAIVQRIIARHGGTVSAEGVVDAGACFGFTLPATGEPA
jgi:PAS domain S-box-containing protein